MEKAIDRRAARTRRSLHKALIALIVRKNYEAITIQDIIDEADIGKSTFYAHFTGKEDLLRGSFEALRNGLTEARLSASAKTGPRKRKPLAFSLAVFEHACGYRPVYRALVGGRGGAVAINEIRRVLSDMVSHELRAYSGQNAVSRDLALEFVVSTFLTVLTWLLMRKQKLTPSQADKMFRQLVINGMGSSLAASS